MPASYESKRLITARTLSPTVSYSDWLTYIKRVTFLSSVADLEKAISQLKESSKVSVPLVVFGHMHKELAHGNGLRKMIVVGSDDTIYLNGAVVPRVKTLSDEQGTSNSFTKEEAHPSSGGTKRAFTIVDILDGRVDKISESWVSVLGDKATLEEELVLFKRSN